MKSIIVRFRAQSLRQSYYANDYSLSCVLTNNSNAGANLYFKDKNGRDQGVTLTTPLVEEFSMSLGEFTIYARTRAAYDTLVEKFDARSLLKV